MEIDWSKAPEGTTHALLSDYDKACQWKKVENDTLFIWVADRWRNTGNWREWKYRFDYIPRPVVSEESIPKGVITAQKLRELALNSGLQIEFHANGDIYVWDDTYEEGTRVNSLEEYVRLAEAKAAYVKLWSDYIWE